ncbi:MAG: hypothetical protein Q8L28_01075, partial [bacterium]|nr:hypothetical protein [bacterium]
MTDIRQSIQYANYLKRNRWIVERIEEVNYFIKKFPLIGSVLKIQRPKEIDFEVIDKLCRKYRVFQVIIEPNLAFVDSSDIHDLLLHNGYKLGKSPYLPTKTLQIDLTQPQKTILSHFKKDARSAIKRGEILTIKDCSSPAGIKIWRKAWKDSVSFNRYVPRVEQLINLRKSFLEYPPGVDTNNSLFLASHNISGSVIGGVLFTISSHDTAYYWYGFTNNEGRTSLSQYALLYQG